ncbi:MAG: hypothetical protein QXF56_03485 [Candidatus Micrarchaeia archaeon]
MRVYKVGDNLACILPKEVAMKLGLKGGEEIDFYEIKPGVFAVMRREEIERVVKEKIGEVELPKKELSDEEMRLLRKLNTIKFSERIPYDVNRKLNSRERDVLYNLIRKGAVRVYKGGKYSKTGVYDISNEIYPLVKKSETPESSLESEGYAVIEDVKSAERVSSALQKEISFGEILGVRGFDKKFYVAKRSWFAEKSESIRRCMGRRVRSMEEISRETKLSEPACRVVLEIMRERGEVIEKRKGFYELV